MWTPPTPPASPAPPAKQSPPAPAWGQPPTPVWGQASAPAWGQTPAPAWGQAPNQPPPGYLPPPKPGVVPLRPLGLGELFDGAFQAVRRNPGATLGLSVLVQLLVGVVVSVAGLPIFSALYSPEFLDPEASVDPVFTDEFGGSLLAFVLVSLVAGLLSGCLMVLVQGLVTVPVLRAALNRKTGFGQTFTLSRPGPARLVGLGLLAAAAGLVVLALAAGVALAAAAVADGAGAALAILAMVAVGVPLFVWIGVKFVFAAHALVAEGLGIFAALGRSWQLTGGRWWRSFGILLLAAVVVSIATSLVTTPLGFAAGMFGAFIDPADPESVTRYLAGLSVVSTLLGAVAGGLGAGYLYAVTALLYTDLRIRREGFDLVLLREFEAGTDLGIPGRQAPVTGPQRAR